MAILINRCLCNSNSRRRRQAPSAVLRAISAAVSLAISFSLFDCKLASAEMSPEMRSGIIAYRGGDYKAAVSSFMGALNTEFNNATLHYYLGNSFVHLKQPDSAIREFRIAYALSPDEAVGKFSKDALTGLGVGTDASSMPAAPLPKPKPVRKPDPIIEQALESLRKQTAEAKSYEDRANDFLSRDAQQRSQQIEQTRNELVRNNQVWRRGRGYVPSDRLPSDTQQMLENLKNQLDSSTNSRRQSSNTRVNELQKTQSNLENLLQDKSNRPGVKLKPAGTNLYTRNYETQK